MTAAEPISDVLEADLRVSVQRHGIVVWLDQHQHYTRFVERLAAARARGELPYDVRSFSGSHLELLLGVEGMGGRSRPRVVVHLPGFTEEDVRASPVLELYCAGTRYRKALGTLIAEAAGGRVRAEEIEAFQKGAATLEEADVWLSELLTDAVGGFRARLRTMRPTTVLEELVTGGPLPVAGEDDRAAIRERLAAWTGWPADWLPESERNAKELAYAAVGWALCVEYVDDLMRAPVSPQLAAAAAAPRAVRDHCRAIADWARTHPEFYIRTADATEQQLGAEREAARAEDLGKIDTFRFEEMSVFDASLRALEQGAYDDAAGWATRRTTGRAFWLDQDPARLSAWLLLRDAATVGQAVEAAGERLAANSLEGATARYTAVGAAVDRAHRHLEQARRRLLVPNVPQFERVRDVLDRMRAVWRGWADAWTRDFCGLCRQQGFLPPPALQQRNLFEDVVRPRTTEPGTTAYFVIDALRYEMADELRESLEGTATRVELSARLAELPTLTAVGMNVLAPVCRDGRLQPAMEGGKVGGFSTGQFRVHDPETRRRAMADRVKGSGCVRHSLDDVLAMKSDTLRRSVAQTTLMVVHGREIDEAGEKDVGLDTFEGALQRLRSAWKLLRDAGVRRFVFTADHGFLLLDDKVRDAQPRGRLIDPKRRYVYTATPVDADDEVRVSATELGYDGAEGYFCFADTTAVFDRGNVSSGFVHGGNSLQERVIPVLTVTHKAPPGGNARKYLVRARAGQELGGMHCLMGTVELVSQMELGFGGQREVQLTLGAVGADVRVELVQARTGGEVKSGVFVATVGAQFELFFRLVASADARCQVELAGAEVGVEVVACTPKEVFGVTALVHNPPETAPAPRPDHHWLVNLPEKVHAVFIQLAQHGTVTEADLAAKLGPRGARQFARSFDEYCTKVPFSIRQESVAGVRRYLREGV